MNVIRVNFVTSQVNNLILFYFFIASRYWRSYKLK